MQPPSRALRVLALEPWLGGSHAAFLAQWRARTRHAVELVGLRARRWRWRMAAGAWELARRVARAGHARPDALFVSDYVDLVSLRGWLPPSWSDVPALLYLHESQLAYPERQDDPAAPALPEGRELHWAFLNLTSVLRAESVAFNSRFHREAFARAASELLGRLPRPSPRAELARALRAARVIAPGVDLRAIPLGPGAPERGPLRVLFNHRFEHDKDPRAFLEAAREALRADAPLELVLLGQRFERLPAGVAELLEQLGPALVHDGYASDRADYAARLGTCDLVVSTARHEFFGMAVLEAQAAGCTPLLPRRLAYPEVALGPAEEGLYATREELVAALVRHAHDPRPLRAPARRAALRAALAPLSADASARALDEALSELVSRA